MMRNTNGFSSSKEKKKKSGNCRKSSFITDDGKLFSLFIICIMFSFISLIAHHHLLVNFVSEEISSNVQFSRLQGEPASSLRSRRIRGSVSNKEYDVIIVGAGAAGLTAAYKLQNHGITNILILEASNNFGGRVQKDDTFTDYPIDLGGTYIYDNELLNQISEKPNIDFTSKIGTWKDENIKQANFKYTGQLGDNSKTSPYFNRPEYTMMFVNYTWYDFFADYIATANVRKNIVYNCQVNEVHLINTYKMKTNHDNKRIKVTCGSNSGDSSTGSTTTTTSYVAKYGIVTVSLKVLQDNVIEFNRPLPSVITNNPGAELWPGFKIFIEFSKKFYYEFFTWDEYDYTIPQNRTGWQNNGEGLFWDYSIVQSFSSKNIMAGYIVGDPAIDLVSLDDNDIFNYVMKKLDDVYEQQATKYYVKHKIINWSKNPYVRGTFTNQYRRRPSVQRILENTTYIAGEGFPAPYDSDNAWVHSAAFSGQYAAEQIIGHLNTPEKQISTSAT